MYMSRVEIRIKSEEPPHLAPKGAPTTKMVSLIMTIPLHDLIILFARELARTDQRPPC